jgi:CHAT domain-containing protein
MKMLKRLFLPAIITLSAAWFAIDSFSPKTDESQTIPEEERFNKHIAPAYTELVDTLLENRQLREVPGMLESSKRVELQKYFGEESVLKYEPKIPDLDAHTAVLYPVLFPERTELILQFSDRICRTTIDVAGEQISNAAKQLHNNIQNRASGRFIRQSRQLYDWLILPIKARLTRRKIDTLITVPDGALRLIPMAGLFNGKQFLVHEYALGTTPSLYLTYPHSLPKENIQIMLNGLSEAVQEFTPLLNVPNEINSIQSLFKQSDVFLDHTFTLKQLKQNMNEIPYHIVHIASHGQFDHDPKNTFILTYDDKLTMDKLEQILSNKGEHPVELLTLSACQTALGDERAALGLAGVAIKAGVGSALASLWSVNDESTAQIMEIFYNHLRKPTLSKAKALQKAQIQVASEQRFRHPAYWAAFLLIGNWL